MATWLKLFEKKNLQAEPDGPDKQGATACVEDVTARHALKETKSVIDAEQTVKSSAEELPEEKPVRQEPTPVPRRPDTGAIYEGEIELALAAPVDLAALAKLHNYLQTTPDIKILYSKGSWDRGVIITVTLDKPLPLLGIISKIPGLVAAAASPEKDNLAKEPPRLVLGVGRGVAIRIDLRLRTE